MKSKNSSVKWIYEQTKHFLPYVMLISLLNALAAVIYVLLANASKNVIDSAALNTQSALIAGGLSLLILIIIQIALDSAISIISIRVSSNINIALRNHMFTKVLRKKYADISQYHSGDLLNRFSSDVEQVVNGCVSIIPSVVSMLTKIIAGIVALLYQNYILAISVLIVGFFLPLMGRLLSKRYKKLHKQVQRSEGQTRSFLQECFANIVVVKTFSGEAPLYDKLNEYMQINKSLKIKRNFLSVLISMSLYFFFTAGYYGVLVWGAGRIAAGVMTTGTLIYFLQLISMLRAPLQNISGVIPRYFSMIASAERLIDLEQLENEPPALREKELQKIDSCFDSIIGDKLAFAYDKSLLLRDCSFEIKRNTVTAITGESGSGKSTLFKLLLGLHSPLAGTLSFDGKALINETTRPMFSYVPQGNMILSGTIRENIALCDKSVSDDKIIKAAKAAVIYDYIASLPDGLDTMLVERGGGLSEGQIQRIAIARALLFNAPIILLDESTSALDEATETQLIKNLKEFTDKTIIFITHRNTSLSACDNILHLENGSFN